MRYTLTKQTIFLKVSTPPSRSNSTHTRRTYTGMRPHAPGQLVGEHPVPAHTESHNPSRVRVTWRKLQTPGNAEEHKKQETPTINPTGQPTNLTDQAPSTAERTARETHNIN